MIAEVLGRAAASEPEAGLDLVEDQQDPELLGQRAHLLMEAFLGQDALGIAEDGLDDDRRDLLAALLEELAEALDPVVASRDDRVGDRTRDATTPRERHRGVGVAQLGHVVRTDADQRVVVDAVVLALELHDPLAARVGARETHEVHRRLGARDRHARHVDPAGQLADELDRPDLVLAGEAEADALAHPLVDVVVDARVAMAEDHRAIAHPQIDVLIPVGVPDERALSPVDVDRALAPGPEVRVGAARHVLRGAPVQRQLALAAEAGGAGGGGLGGHEVLGYGFGWPGPWDGRCAIRDARDATLTYGPVGRQCEIRAYRNRGVRMTANAGG